MNAIHYRVMCSIAGSQLLSSRLMFDRAIGGTAGIDPQSLSRGYPPHCLKTLQEWVRLADLATPLGPLLVQTARNAVQNRRCIVVTRELGVVQSAAEQAERSTRPYRGVAFLDSGRLRADTFTVKDGLAADVQQFVAGIPVLWDGRALTAEEFASEVADFSHLFALQVTAADGAPTKDPAIFAALRAAFEAHRDSDANTASQALFDAARAVGLTRPPLIRERAYLHNAIGVRPDGGVVALIAHGTLEQIGELTREAGATSAVVVDNGGSSALASRRTPGGELRPLVESSYFRAPSIAAVLYEMKDARGAIFVPRQRLTAAGPTTITDLRRRSFDIAVQFDTDVGLVRRTVTVARDDSDAADLVALTIANFAAIHGAHAAHVDASDEFVAHVASRFAERFRATPATQDLDGMRGLWLENYFTSVFEREFRITGGPVPTDADRGEPAVPGVAPPDGDVPETAHPWSLGVDIGAGHIKTLLLKDGVEVGAESRVPTRAQGRVYDSTALADQIRSGILQALRHASVDVADVDRIGISWPGAVRRDVVAHSRTLLDLADVTPDGLLKVAVLDRLRRLSPVIRGLLPFRPKIPIDIYNDGEVEVAYEAATSARRGLLLCKLGTSVAGGFIDRAGTHSYLTELGRAVIRTDAGAPFHPFSRIRGMASLLIGSAALAEQAVARGITTVAGEAVSAGDAGLELGAVIERGAAGADASREIVVDMGRSLACLITECAYHLREIDHVVIRGGPAGDHTVGRLLRQSARDHLPADLAATIDQSTASLHSGAFAAAWLSARRKAH